MGGGLAGGDIPQLDDLFFWGYFDGLTPGEDIDGKLRPKCLFIGNKQVRFFSDDTADMIRESTVGIRNVWTAFHHENLGFFIEPAQTRRT
jgi:hypothetical protein